MENKLFGNPGKKVKNLAKWIAIVMAVIFVIGGFVLIYKGATNTYEDYDYYYGYREFSEPDWVEIIIGIAIAVAGPFLSYISSLTLYAFGQLVQINEEILANSKKAE